MRVEARRRHVCGARVSGLACAILPLATAEVDNRNASLPPRASPPAAARRLWYRSHNSARARVTQRPGPAWRFKVSARAVSLPARLHNGPMPISRRSATRRIASQSSRHRLIESLGGRGGGGLLTRLARIVRGRYARLVSSGTPIVVVIR